MKTESGPIRISKLEIIGYEDVLSDEDTPVRVLPVFAPRDEPESFCDRPYEWQDGRLQARLRNIREFERRVKSGACTALERHLPARAGHVLILLSQGDLEAVGRQAEIHATRARPQDSDQWLLYSADSNAVEALRRLARHFYEKAIISILDGQHHLALADLHSSLEAASHRPHPFILEWYLGSEKLTEDFSAKYRRHLLNEIRDRSKYFKYKEEGSVNRAAEVILGWERLKRNWETGNGEIASQLRHFWEHYPGYPFYLDDLDYASRWLWRVSTEQRRAGKPEASDLFEAGKAMITKFMDAKVQVNRSEPTLYLQRMQFREALHDFPGMKSDALEALDIEPDETRMDQEASYTFMYETGKANALRLLGRVAVFDRDLLSAVQHFDDAEQLFGKWEERLRSSGQAKGVNFVVERRAQCSYYLGCLLNKRNRVESARDALTGMLDKDKSRFPQGFLARGDCHLFLRDWPKAKADFDDYMKLRPKSYAGPDKLRILHRRMGDAEAERKQIIELLTLAEDSQDTTSIQRNNYLLADLSIRRERSIPRSVSQPARSLRLKLYRSLPADWRDVRISVAQAQELEQRVERLNQTSMRLVGRNLVEELWVSLGKTDLAWAAFLRAQFDDAGDIQDAYAPQAVRRATL